MLQYVGAVEPFAWGKLSAREVRRGARRGSVGSACGGGHASLLREGIILL